MSAAADYPCKVNCDDSDHLECAEAICPHDEPLHNHHDGCPACYHAEMEAPADAE